MSARQKLYNFISKNGTKIYSGQELADIAQTRDWPRAMRQMRQDKIINYEIINQSDYAISLINDYISSTKREGLNEKDKYRIRNRDGHRCQSCGKGVNDNVTLHVDHKIPLDCGGTHDDDNLWTLCHICNGAKQAFFKDEFDSQVMMRVFRENSGYQKLKVLFENSPGKKFTPSVLQGISGIRDWPRTIRLIRTKEKINIIWYDKTDKDPNGYYINEPTV